MRDRKEIENDLKFNRTSDNCLLTRIAIDSHRILEVLLDIRDLLANPPVEISGIARSIIDTGPDTPPSLSKDKELMKEAKEMISDSKCTECGLNLEIHPHKYEQGEYTDYVCPQCRSIYKEKKNEETK